MRGHALVWMTVIGLSLGVAYGAAQDPKVVAKYNDTWGAKEKDADTTRKRLALVREMIDAAVDTQDKDLRLYIFDKAFFLGLRDYPDGHRLAAQAVHLIQETDTGQRMDCLLRLDRLYTAGWHIDKRSHLGAGMEAARVKVEMAQRRLLELFREHRTKGLEKIQFMGELNRIKGEYISAYTTANQVISTATRYGSSHPDKKVRQSLTQFAQDNAPILDKIKEARDEILDLYRAYGLNGDEALPAHQRPGAPEPVEVADASPTPTSTPRPTTKLPSSKPALPKSTSSPDTPAASDPDPQPEQVADTPPVDNAFTKAIKAGHWREQTCSKCRDPFVPAFGDKSGVCYWCSRKSNIFDGK